MSKPIIFRFACLFVGLLASCSSEEYVHYKLIYEALLDFESLIKELTHTTGMSTSDLSRYLQDEEDDKIDLSIQNDAKLGQLLAKYRSIKLLVHVNGLRFESNWNSELEQFTFCINPVRFPGWAFTLHTDGRVYARKVNNAEETGRPINLNQNLWLSLTSPAVNNELRRKHIPTDWLN